MKILYITLFHGSGINGGTIYCKAVINAMSRIVGNDNIEIVTLESDQTEWNSKVVYKMPHYSSTIQKIQNVLSGNITQICNHDVDVIIKLINKNQYDIVAFGNSETGKLVRKIKLLTKARTITMYNDIIADVINKKLKSQFNPLRFLMWKAEINAEKADIKYSDIHCVLHHRDAALMKKHWDVEPELIAPICIEDKNPTAVSEPHDMNDTMRLLFVGSYGWPSNVEAAVWFANMVMTRLTEYNIEFCIAGFGMENLKSNEEIKQYDNVTILGTVDDLSKVYSDADLVVEPILNGSGMKVKTAEALMFGKEIIGTDEAVIGYDCLEQNICNTAEEFILRIITYYHNRPDKYVEKNRKEYEEKYSIDAMANQIRQVLHSLIECEE